MFLTISNNVWYDSWASSCQRRPCRTSPYRSTISTKMMCSSTKNRQFQMSHNPEKRLNMFIKLVKHQNTYLHSYLEWGPLRAFSCGSRNAACTSISSDELLSEDKEAEFFRPDEPHTISELTTTPTCGCVFCCCNELDLCCQMIETIATNT